MVAHALVADEPMSETERDEVLKAWCRRHRLEDPQALKAEFRAKGLSRSDWEWQVLLPVRIKRYCAKNFGMKAEARFLAQKQQLDKVVYSLLRVKDGSLARELYLRISGREATFAEVARSHSQGPERDTCGIVGPVALTQSHPLLAERLRTSDPGETMPPFLVGEWWLVARVEKRLPACFDTGMAEKMNRENFEEWLSQVSADTMQDVLSRIQANSHEDSDS